MHHGITYNPRPDALVVCINPKSLVIGLLDYFE